MPSVSRNLKLFSFIYPLLLGSSETSKKPKSSTRLRSQVIFSKNFLLSLVLPLLPCRSSSAFSSPSPFSSPSHLSLSHDWRIFGKTFSD